MQSNQYKMVTHGTTQKWLFWTGAHLLKRFYKTVVLLCSEKIILAVPIRLSMLTFTLPSFTFILSRQNGLSFWQDVFLPSLNICILVWSLMQK